jgi:hypothetical protein
MEGLFGDQAKLTILMFHFNVSFIFFLLGFYIIPDPSGGQNDRYKLITFVPRYQQQF